MSATPLREDLLTGASAIAEYLGWSQRRVYYCADKGYLPIVRSGAILTARKSQLDRALSVLAPEAA
jgi:hypothetical protein